MPQLAESELTARPHNLGSSEATVVCDRGWTLQYASPAAAAILGIPPELLHPGVNFLHLVLEAEGHQHGLSALLQSALESLDGATLLKSSLRSSFRAENDTVTQVDLHSIDRELFAVSLRSKMTPADRNIDALNRDALTGVGSRCFFQNQLLTKLSELATGTVESAAVILLDLDRFKMVNDTLGHSVGDDLLRLVSQRIRTEIAGNGVLARMGGDEFALLLAPSPPQQELDRLLSRLIDLVQRTYLIDGHVVHIGASIGIALAPQDSNDPRQLEKLADLALYDSKRRGRGMYSFFRPEMEKRAQDRRDLELELRKALVLRQFELHYQPEIDATTQSIMGLEALLRWRHPQRGLLMPGEFLAVAEEIGMASPLGEWVLKTICQEAKRWPKAIRFAVNISPRQFEGPDFVASVQRALLSAGIAAERIDIELTEDILLGNSSSVLATVQSLRSLGVRVTLDDFGTGVASLSQLVRLPFDKIKIDRSLIASNGGCAQNRAIIRAISALGSTLGISTLAEGVETQQHLEQVRAQGCHTVQGFYYSEAVPSTDLPNLFQRFVARSE